MMPRLRFSLFLFLSFGLGLLAQESGPEVQVGALTEMGRMESCYQYVGKTEKGVYLSKVRFSNQRLIEDPIQMMGLISLDLYDEQQLSLIKTIDMSHAPLMGAEILPYGNSRKYKSFEFLLQDNEGNIWLYFSAVVDQYTHLFRQKLDEEELKFEKPILVSSHGSVKEKSVDLRSSFSAIVSPDNRNLGIYSFSTGIDETDKHRVYVEVFDEDFNSKFRIDAVIPEYHAHLNKADRLRKQLISAESQDYDYGFNIRSFTPYLDAFSNTAEGMLNPSSEASKIALCNNGVLCVLKKVPLDVAGIEESIDSYFVLYSYSENNELPNRTVLEEQSNRVASPQLLQEKNKLISVVSFYKEEKKEIEGVYIQTFRSTDLASLNRKYIPFTEQQKRDFLVSDQFSGNTKKASKEQVKIEQRLAEGKALNIDEQYHIIGLYRHKNDHLSILSEHLDLHTVNSIGASAFEGQTGNLVFLNISPKGEIQWIKTCNKRQRSLSPSELGTSSFFRNDEIHFLFNNQESHAIGYGNINVDGNLYYQSMFDLSPLNRPFVFSLQSSLTERLSDNQYYGIARERHRQCLLRFDF